MRPHHRILSLEILGSTFYGDALFEFADGLNTLMGARGSGKTTCLSFLRFALGLPIPAAYAKDFDAHVERVLGPGTVVVRVLTQHGVEYRYSRAYGEEPKVHNASGELVKGSSAELFALDAYGAKQIEQMASRPDEQLALIDKFAPAEIRALGHALEDVERRIAQVAAEIDRLAATIETDRAREDEIPVVTEALKGLTPVDALLGDEVARVEARRVGRGREQIAATALGGRVGKVREAVDHFAREGQRLLAGVVEGELERAADPIGGVFRRSHEAVRGAAGAIEAAAASLRAELARAAAVLEAEARSLAAIHDAEDQTYKAIVVRQDTDKERATERERLHKRRDELAAIAKQLDERRREVVTKEAEHSALMSERARLLGERHAVRLRIATEVTAAVKGEVHVTVKQGGLITRYLALLTELLEKSGLSKEYLAGIAESVPPAELYALVQSKDVDALVQADRLKTGKAGRADKLVKLLGASGRLREVETAPVDDLPVIELVVEGRRVLASTLSTGQRVTAILPLLLVQSANPLAIDQVEDHLDNRFITQVFVPTILAAKGSRQFLFATHNPNIPVLGEAEQVFEHAVADGIGRVTASGAVGEMWRQVERQLEGGRAAFVKRGERYGHLQPSKGST